MLTRKGNNHAFHFNLLMRDLDCELCGTNPANYFRIS